MPVEAILSRLMPEPYDLCPRCRAPFESFLRGQVARFGWFGLRRRVWCVICRACKHIVGYEAIPRAASPVVEMDGTR